MDNSGNIGCDEAAVLCKGSLSDYVKRSALPTCVGMFFGLEISFCDV